MSSSTPQLDVEIATPWITVDDILDVVPSIARDSDQFDKLSEYAQVASDLMFRLSGRQFPGSLQRKVRPCRTGCGCWGAPSTGFTYWSWTYANIGGYQWRNEGGDACGCGSESYVTLAGPVVSVDEVKINGVVIAPSDYRLDNRRHLIYMADVTQDPPLPRMWPGCQDLDLDDTQQGTFSVTYTWGANPPMLGKMAAAQLAAELWKAGPGVGECSLPARVTKVVRQGVTMDKITPVADVLMKGLSGLTFVDMFIAGYNPTKVRRRPAIWSPDVQLPARKVGQ